MRVQKPAAFALVLTLALPVLGACSKKDDSTASTSGAPAAASSSGDNGSGGGKTTTTKSSDSGSSDKTTTTKDSGSSDSSLPDLGNVGNLNTCMKAAAAYATVVLEPLGLMGKATKADIDKFKKDVADLKAEIPAELKDDFDTVAAAWNDFAQVYGNIDLSDPSTYTDPAKAAQLEEASKKLDEPAVKDAQKRIDDYFATKCK